MKRYLLFAALTALSLTASVSITSAEELTVLYSEDFSDGLGDHWNGRYLTRTLVEGDAVHGNYVQLADNTNTKSYYAYYLIYSDSASTIYNGVNTYTVEFDALFGHVVYYQESNELALFGEGYTLPSSPRYGDASDLAEGDYLFDIEGGAKTSEYSVNEDFDRDSIDLDSAQWYHFKIDVNIPANTSAYTINKEGGDETISGTLTDVGSMNCQGVFFRAARNNGYIGFDNIKITTTDEVSGIRGVASSSNVNISGCYNLSGQRVGDNYKGIVIRNGKKIIKK